MRLIGKATINPIIFYSGKICGYLTWVLLLLSLLNIFSIDEQKYLFLKYLSYCFIIVGLFFVTISLVNLGKSVRLGIPNEQTELKTHGIYKISRNPMYVGFNLFTISSLIYISSLLTAFMGIYSIIVYHYIIIGEEIFLQKSFKEKFVKYQEAVRRYF